MRVEKKMYKRIICFIIGHQHRITSCPFTGLKYDKCDRCSGSIITGRVEDEKENINSNN